MTAQETAALTACKEGISIWQKAFNSQDAAVYCPAHPADSVMDARPFGTFKGRDAIQAFWQNIMDQGYSDVAYTDVKWQAVSEEGQEPGYILTSSWTMNKAFGVVHKEYWVVEADGRARLLTDDFEIQGER